MGLLVRFDNRRVVVRTGLVWLFASMALAKSGPFGTFDGMNLHMRLCYWCLVVGAALLIAIILRRAVQRFLSRRSRLEQDLVLAVGLGAAFTPPLYMFSCWMSDGEALGMTFVEMALVVVAVPLGLTFIREAFAALGDREKPAPGPRLAERLPDQHRGSIRAVSGRDHYVDVLTGAGQVEILLRFSDALRELDGADGMQVHRSHWVARSEVLGLERDGSRSFLRLTCGRRIPVSRTFRDQVIESWALNRDPEPFDGAWEPEPHAIRTEPPRQTVP